MQIFIYILYAVSLIAFLVFASFAIYHSFRYRYIAPRVRIMAWIFIFVSLILITISFYFLTQVRL